MSEPLKFEVDAASEILVPTKNHTGAESYYRDTAPASKAGLRYLHPEEYPAWDDLIDVSPQGSVFSKSWWLNSVGGATRILGYFKNGRLIAGIPLYFERRLERAICTMPKLTHTLGPILPPLNGDGRQAREKTILCAFAAALSEYPIFFQAFHPSVQNWSPFYWQGFTQTSRATYVLDLRRTDSPWKEMTRRARRSIRHAMDHGFSVRKCAPDDVWEAERKTFAAQKMKVPHSIEYLRGLYRAAREHDAGECFASVDEKQIVHSAAFMVWTHSRAYAVALGRDLECPISGAASLLISHMIEFAAQRSPILDFTGSMLEGVDSFIASFGATQVAYSWIMRFPLWLKFYLSWRHKI